MTKITLGTFETSTDELRHCTRVLANIHDFSLELGLSEMEAQVIPQVLVFLMRLQETYKHFKVVVL